MNNMHRARGSDRLALLLFGIITVTVILVGIMYGVNALQDSFAEFEALRDQQ